MILRDLSSRTSGALEHSSGRKTNIVPRPPYADSHWRSLKEVTMNIVAQHVVSRTQLFNSGHAQDGWAVA